ncbi:hypothetical protein [uncultured Maricaulis sp.]|uniref:hypothetical protein n=1 Tax=uncultured Maricaulis sp. TaxID=174710 RepID=UPI0030DD638B|tara:strand:+ start:21512 stop:21862 length:351 start_codon:yes stop_codon:yes gene_type:complete
MPRLTLVPPTAQRPPPCPVEEFQAILAELHACRDGETDGPAVLWLINDLMRYCEDRLEECDNGSAEGAALVLRRQKFLAGLTGFAEQIRKSNGELSDEFIAFLATAPAAMDDLTTN